jgi:hypothetical protein
MISYPSPKTLNEAVKICLLTMTAREKTELTNASEENLITIHFGWAVNMRNKFGLWQTNYELIRSCGAANPDDVSMVIVRAV